MTDAISQSIRAEGIDSLRPVLMGTRHMAVAGHYGAAHAAFTILEGGGNAIDAGVAAGIALGVLQSDLVNVAGVAPIMIRLAKTGEILTISGLGTWPRAITPDFFAKRFGGAIPNGVLRTIVPAAPDAWITALERYGTMTFGDCAQAAIRFARDGFPMYPLMSQMIAMHMDDYARWPSSAAIYLPDGRPPRPGERFVQRDLGRTLSYLVDCEKAASGRGRASGLRAVRDAFYRGDIARAIVAYHREHDGLMTAEDLASFRVAIERPVHTPFRDLDVYTCGPWCQGPALLEMLNIVGGLDLHTMGHNSVDYVHALTETIKLAFADRERYFGDPRFVDMPIDTLLSASYAKERRAAIRADRASPGMPAAGVIAGRDENSSPRPTRERASAGAHDTSCVSVIDKDGNVFAATPSDPSYDTPVIPGTGLCPSSRGSQSFGNPSHPSCPAPGKRPRLTPMVALAMLPDGSPMPLNTPGGDVQAQALLQVLLNMNVFGMNPQQAVEAPRFASYSFPDSFEPHSYSPGLLYVEDRIPQAVREALTSRGHEVATWPDFVWRAGAVCVQRANRETGIIAAGADPRRPCYAVGW
ncbi:MAG TPA: gamma-glutamyltransferase [Casimicrobiaceae bacterium]|nr:gamma-glutamyltransferase [Casimicrobiaceae bacterium]